MNRLSAFSVPWGPESQERERDEHQRPVDEDENYHRDHRDRGGRLGVDQVVQRGEIGGAGCADRRANEDGEPVPRLVQDSLGPRSQFRRRPFLR